MGSSAPVAAVARLTTRLVLVLGIALATIGCRAEAAGGGARQVRGVIIAVQPRSIAQADTVTIRADDGRELTFRVDPSVDVTPGHLREHMTLGEPVVVTYRQDGSGLLAQRIDDG
jgi:hypothetical protein